MDAPDATPMLGSLSCSPGIRKLERRALRSHFQNGAAYFGKPGCGARWRLNWLSVPLLTDRPLFRSLDP